ncbi:MAG: hypothetical protein Q8O14_14745 [bacterium]|nr:hypothetical protein [bacterium]
MDKTKDIMRLVDIPHDQVAICASPKTANGSTSFSRAVPRSANPTIVAGCWARFAHWPLAADNPPRRVEGITDRQVCWLTPRAGWRTFARTMDLVLVDAKARKAYVATVGSLVDQPQPEAVEDPE